MTNQKISTKKLKAIVFTDIVDFTKISAEDEQHALDIIHKQREILKPIVLEYKGEWLKEIGDGLLFSFDSSLDAVRCSIKIQEALRDIDDFKLRIGIHQGDIFITDGDVYGDDVNIASRVEGCAPEGGIAISDKISKDISGVKDIKTSFIGYRKLKGVEQETQIKAITSHNMPNDKRFSLPIVGAYISFFMSSLLILSSILIIVEPIYLNELNSDSIKAFKKAMLFGITYLFIGYSSLSYSRGVSLHSQKLLTYLTYIYILYPIFNLLSSNSKLIEILYEDNSSNYEVILLLIFIVSCAILPITLYYLFKFVNTKGYKSNRNYLIFINMLLILFCIYYWYF